MSDLGFYGAAIAPGQKVVLKPGKDRVLRISMVALASSKSVGKEKTQLLITSGGNTFTVATLSERIPHATLDLFFVAGHDSASFTTKGKDTLHITGYSTFLDATDEDVSKDMKKEPTPLPPAANNVASSSSSSSDEEDIKTKAKPPVVVKNNAPQKKKKPEVSSSSSSSSSSDSDSDAPSRPKMSGLKRQREGSNESNPKHWSSFQSGQSSKKQDHKKKANKKAKYP